MEAEKIACRSLISLGRYAAREQDAQTYSGAAIQIGMYLYRG
jgi:hypothetical protein